MEINSPIARRTVLFCVVLIAHSGAIVFLSYGLKVGEARLGSTRGPASTLTFVDPTQFQPHSELEKGSRRAVFAKRVNTKVSIANQANSESERAPSEVGTVDWPSFKDDVVRDAVNRERQRAEQDRFSSQVTRSSVAPLKVPEHDDFPWDKHRGRRTGFTDEGLPYVALSKKCAVVLLFLVCGFGGEIKPEGDLFTNLPEKADKIRVREIP